MESLSTAQAASILGVSVVRVRQLLHEGVLAGELEPRGSRALWRVDSDSVAAVLAHRQAQGRSRLTLAGINERLTRLEALISAGASATPRFDTAHAGDQSNCGAGGDGRSGVDMLALRAVAAEHAAADAERSKVIENLLAALTSAEKADAHRRAAIEAAETELGMRLIPDDVSQLSAAGSSDDSDGESQG